MFGILGGAATVVGLIAFGWALCKAAGDADDRQAAMMARHRENLAVRSAHPTNVVRLPCRRPYDYELDGGA